MIGVGDGLILGELIGRFIPEVALISLLLLVDKVVARKPLGVCNFFGEANRFPILRDGVCVASPLGKWRLQTR